MRNLYSFPPFLLLVMAILGCNSSDKKKQPDSTTSPSAAETVFEKLEGTWMQGDRKSFERWVKKSDGSYRAEGFSVNGTDTTWNERASIYHDNDLWIFENTVAGQNDGKSVKFSSTILENNRVQFSNPAHDFPTDINYHVTNDSTLDAFIVGPNNEGGKDTVRFKLKKVK